MYIEDIEKLLGDLNSKNERLFHISISLRAYAKSKKELKLLAEMLKRNIPHRHENYQSTTFAIQVEGNWFGLTYAFITHSKYESKPFDQQITPYTAEGRKRYLQRCNKNKSLPCDRPSINTPEEIAFSIYQKGKYWKKNFEYYMNREYAYNRDKGKCKCCGKPINSGMDGHCHHVDNKLPIDKINKVQNLAWVCVDCHHMIHNHYPQLKHNKIMHKIVV